MVGGLWIWVSIQFLGVEMVLQENGLRRNVMRHLTKHHDNCHWLSNAQDKKQTTLIYPQHGEAGDKGGTRWAAGALGAGIGMFLVLFFQLFCGFEIFQKKKARRKGQQLSSPWNLFWFQSPWLCLAPLAIVLDFWFLAPFIAHPAGRFPLSQELLFWVSSSFLDLDLFMTEYLSGRHMTFLEAGKNWPALMPAFLFCFLLTLCVPRKFARESSSPRRRHAQEYHHWQCLY